MFLKIAEQSECIYTEQDEPFRSINYLKNTERKEYILFFYEYFFFLSLTLLVLRIFWILDDPALRCCSGIALLYAVTHHFNKVSLYERIFISPFFLSLLLLWIYSDQNNALDQTCTRETLKAGWKIIPLIPLLQLDCWQIFCSTFLFRQNWDYWIIQHTFKTRETQWAAEAHNTTHRNAVKYKNRYDH